MTMANRLPAMRYRNAYDWALLGIIDAVCEDVKRADYSPAIFFAVADFWLAARRSMGAG